ncbi:ABC transporter substrate-binding protein [Anaeromyxobacter diazotrophicus]|uniref:Ethanolamine utilization protein EutJ n=1 Tax=Anaeromyxobacter diazotrophicus TaxID=2590199 RepID=A0A7I9VMG4_9BACT|nr:ABC transporter substrate-binding protein [Anaeromyxobacter diazotrophicus]GEJ57593.1 ethanolamine utilization protein EutJ [Anaeromyxobacter diazotrophicus]
MRLTRTLALMAAVVAVAACQDKKQEAPAPAAPQAAAPAAGGAPAGDKLVFGHVASMTGNEATFGDSTDKGIKLAVDEANKAGGVKGKQLTVKTLDDQGKPEEAAVAATRLVTQDGATVLLGEVASSRSLAMAPIADSNKVPMITPTSTNPRVTKDGDKTRPYVFRVCFIDPFQGTVMAKFARENLKINNVAVLRDVGNDYSVGLANFFAAKFKDLGGTIVADESYKAGDQDFKAQLTAIKNKKIQAIYVPGYYTDVALIARQARELGIKVPLMGGDGWDSVKLYEIAKGALDGSYFSNHYSSEDPSPVIQGFVKKYKETYGSVPDALAVLGYDAANVAIDAMKRAKDLTGPSIRDAIEQTKGYQAVSGVINLDQDHNAVKSAVVLAIKNNEAHFAATVNP